MPRNWIVTIDSHVRVNEYCIMAVAHLQNFPTALPLTPNVREPNVQSPTFKIIYDSLVAEPHKFFERNSGIVISANKAWLEADNKKHLHLEILEDSEGGYDGVINGGHTMMAIDKAAKAKKNLVKGRVKVIVYIGLDEDETKDIALTSNTASPIDSRSRFNALGQYDYIKKFVTKLELKEKRKFRISYYQNQSGAPKDIHCNVNHIIKLVNCLDRNKYNSRASRRLQHPTKNYTPSKISDKEKTRIETLLPLLTNALWIEQRLCQMIEEYISHPKRKGKNDLASINLRRNTLLADVRYAFGFSIPADLALPLVASYRVFLNEKYEWIIPFDDFAEDYLRHAWDNHFRRYLIQEKLASTSVGTKVSRDQSIWELLYIVAQEYLNDKLMQVIAPQKREVLVLSPHPPNPQKK